MLRKTLVLPAAASAATNDLVAATLCLRHAQRCRINALRTCGDA